MTKSRSTGGRYTLPFSSLVEFCQMFEGSHFLSHLVPCFLHPLSSLCRVVVSSVTCLSFSFFLFNYTPFASLSFSLSLSSLHEPSVLMTFPFLFSFLPSAAILRTRDSRIPHSLPASLHSTKNYIPSTLGPLCFHTLPLP